MPKENSVNLDQTASARNVELVVSDSGPCVANPDPCVANGDEVVLRLPQASVASQPVGQTESIYQGNHDPEKIMRDLPVDEFFKVLEQSTPEQLQALIHSFEKGARTKGGSKLLKKIIDVPDGPRSIISTLVWWECRRPLYNLILALAGSPSVLFFLLFGFGQAALFGAAFYGILANVCYSLGAPAEAVARACWKDKAANYGPVLLTLGTIFSVILTIVIELLVSAVFALSVMARF